MNLQIYHRPWATQINLDAKRSWLQITGHKGEFVAGVVVNGQVGWLKAKVLPSSIHFSGRIDEPAKVKSFRPADPQTVERIERELPRFVARGF